jgi:hypothetical protein
MNTASQILGEARKVLGMGEPLDLRDRSKLVRNLVFIYQVITASEKLLEVAVLNTPPGLLRNYYLEHLKEERGHVHWLEEDLLGAGVDPNKFPISVNARAMVGSVYYDIFHVSSAALLGYMLVLEGFPMSREVVDHLEELHGSNLLRTLRYHAEHDVAHSKDVAEMLEIVPKVQKEIARQTAFQTAVYLNRAQQELI